MEIRKTLQQAADRLGEEGIEEPWLEAEVLLRHLLGLSHAQLYSSWDSPIDSRHQREYLKLTQRRLQGEPSAYITGHREFYGLDFLVDPRVLIPRPETELLVELALRFATEKGFTSSPCVVADVGTGSGALAVTLAVHLPEARVYATDISAEALVAATLNCKRHGVEERVTLLQGDLAEPLPEPVDILVANLPYVGEADIGSLPGEIRNFEPRVAYDGGEDGLMLIRRLLPQARVRLRGNGALFLEVGDGHGERVLGLSRGLYPDARVGLQKDLAGIDRALEIYTGIGGR